MPLTDAAIRNAKPKDKAWKLYDGKGLYLEVAPAGGKWWRFKYRIGGKEKRLSFGVYPEVSLLKAREALAEARRRLSQGVDPAEERKAVKAAESGADSFEAVAREWHTKFSPTWAASHAVKIIGRLEKHVFPWLGKRPVDAITAPELLAVIRRIETIGNLDTAHRALQNCGQVFRYAVQTGRATGDPSGSLRGAIPPARKRHFAALTDPAKVGLLVKTISEYHGLFTTKAALMLAPLVFTRPSELRKAEWQEFDLDRAEWRIPIERMKVKLKEKNERAGEVGHIVPLSKQAVAVLRDLYQLTGGGRILFPGLRGKEKPISDATMTNALRRMGYSGEEMQVHGFRHMASTLLHEMGFPSHVIEKQLAHADHNKIRAVYNQAEYLPERRKMMQAWADYLELLAAGEENKIVPIRAAR